MTEQMVGVNGVELCVETFGDPADSALLLIPGAGGSMETWEADFCLALAAVGRFVIRYDLRDTGRSVSYPVGAPGYGFLDLVGDAVGLVEVFGGGRAGVAGLSMGGAIGQYMAVDHAEKVASLALISTSPVFAAELPPLTAQLLEAYGAMTDPDWGDREAVVEHLVRGARIHWGPLGFDEGVVREAAGRIYDRSPDLRTTGNHNVMKRADGPERDMRALLSAVSVPTIVIHGAADPMFPSEHGAAVAEAIPGAELLVLDGVGHQAPPRPTWSVVVPAIAFATTG
ncbi:pimeloyl-ACP methyl ester carboxylesterase [Catenulispora sp. MAP5-51]|uniref:alpha/beta fold hydrolase n=1 Tax=Catenulispora sp. MAP5-51 TaxID=3156298 RepID=UPI00351749A3